MANWSNKSIGNNAQKGYVHFIFYPQHDQPQRTTTDFIEETQPLLQSINSAVSRKPWCAYFHLDQRPGHHEHIHVLYWHYRNSPTTRCLLEHCHRFGLRFKWSVATDYVRLLKYLQEDQWKLLLGDSYGGIKLAPTGRSSAVKFVAAINTKVRGLGIQTQEGGECQQLASEEGLPVREETTRSVQLSGNATQREDASGRIGQGKIWETLRKLIPTLQAIDYADFERKCIAQDYDWFISNMNRKNFEQYAMRYINTHCIYVQTLQWGDIMSKVNVALTERIRAPYCSIKESQLWIETICSYNGWDSNTFTMDVLTIVNKGRPKINTLIFNGPPNCGKTLIANSICDSLMYYSCNNTFNARTSQFAMQEFVRARIIMLDEISISTEFKDKMLLLFGGSDCDTDVKNKGHVIIRRTPVIICFNVHPSRGLMTSERPLFESAVAARSIEYKFRKCDQLKNLAFDRLHPLVWQFRIAALNGRSANNCLHSVNRAESNPVAMHDETPKVRERSTDSILSVPDDTGSGLEDSEIDQSILSDEDFIDDTSQASRLSSSSVGFGIDESMDGEDSVFEHSAGDGSELSEEEQDTIDEQTRAIVGEFPDSEGEDDIPNINNEGETVVLEELITHTGSSTLHLGSSVRRGQVGNGGNSQQKRMRLSNSWQTGRSVRVPLPGNAVLVPDSAGESD